MKRFIAMIVVVMLCTTALVGCAKQQEREVNKTYTLNDCCVYDVGKYEGEIAIIDQEQDIWTWHDDLDVNVGDRCVLTMSDNGTPNYLYDDMIISIEWIE